MQDISHQEPHKLTFISLLCEASKTRRRLRVHGVAMRLRCCQRAFAQRSWMSELAHGYACGVTRRSAGPTRRSAVGKTGEEAGRAARLGSGGDALHCTAQRQRGGRYVLHSSWPWAVYRLAC